MTDENNWRASTFRQSIVTKIEEAIRQSGMHTTRNSIEMENHVFQKAKNKEEYLGFVARLILHVREMKPKQGGGMAVPGQGQAGPGMPDPINALQNLASQGTRNSIMTMGPQSNPMGGPQQAPATNLLQTLNRGPAQQMMMGVMPGSMPMQTWQDNRNQSKRKNEHSVNNNNHNNNNNASSSSSGVKNNQPKKSETFKIHCISESDELEIGDMLNDDTNSDDVAMIVEELDIDKLIDRKSDENESISNKRLKDTEIATDVARIKSITSEENRIKKKYYEEKLGIMRNYHKEKLKRIDKLLELKSKKYNVLEKIAETLEKLR